jgi:gluconolactonase
MKLSNYSLNYAKLIARGELDAIRFLDLCRQLGLEGASLHLRDLKDTSPTALARLRRAYLDGGLSVAMFTVSTNFGVSEDRLEKQMDEAREAIRVAVFLGAPLLRVFPGSPAGEADRAGAFERAAKAMRRLCDEAAQVGLPIGLQNHNHGALCRTGEEVIRFIKTVDHPNLTFVLDCGQFAGSPGASGRPPKELEKADFVESIRQTASLARHVRVKFYHPRADGSEPGIPYPEILNILRGVHYQSFLDIVYEPGPDPLPADQEVRAAISRVVGYLRKLLAETQAPTAAQSPGPVARYAGLQNATYFESASIGPETSVAFLEGPTVDGAGTVYFSDTTAERIYRWHPSEKRQSVFREHSNQANGLALDRQGRLLACEAGGRVTRTDVETGKIEVLAESYHGFRIGAPNDLDIDAQGRIYFSSRLANRDPKIGNVNAVYRIDPDGSLVRLLAIPQIDMPNGLAVSPDQKTFYLIDADGRANRARRIRAYDLSPEGTLSNERLVFDFYPGRSGDGMSVDAEGNLYVAAGLHRPRGTSETLDTRPGIHVISPQGKLVAFLETPEDTITNCAFGGGDRRTLYVTCGKQLLSVRTKIPGRMD